MLRSRCGAIFEGSGQGPLQEEVSKITNYKERQGAVFKGKHYSLEGTDSKTARSSESSALYLPTRKGKSFRSRPETEGLFDFCSLWPIFKIHSHFQCSWGGASLSPSESRVSSATAFVRERGLINGRMTTRQKNAHQERK